MAATTRVSPCLAMLCGALLACAGGKGTAGDPDATDVPAEGTDVPPEAAGDPGTVADPGDDTPASELPGGDVPAGDVPGLPGVVRFVHVSDVHYRGVPEDPQPDWIAAGVADINGLAGDPDFVVLTGDLVHFMDPKYEVPGVKGPMHLLSDGFQGIQRTWYPVIGNHDHYVQIDPYVMTADLEARRAVWRDAWHTEPWYSVDVKGVRFVMLDSVDGPDWDSAQGLVGCFGNEQMAWLSGLLEAGMPTILFLHHPPTSLVKATGTDALCAVLAAHPGTVRAILAGHNHEFMEGTCCGTPFYVVGNDEPSGPHHYLVEYDGLADHLTLLNRADVPLQQEIDWTCDPQGGGLPDPAVAGGTLHRLDFTNVGSADAGATGQFVVSALADLPMVLQVVSHDTGTSRLAARLAMGDAWTTDGYVGYVAGAPCESMVLELDGGCATGQPVAFTLNLAAMASLLTDATVDPTWVLRIDVTSLAFDLELEASQGAAAIAGGVLRMTLGTTRVAGDVKTIVAKAYCAGSLDGCLPGQDAAHPACPVEPAAELFDLLPESCDLSIEGIPARLLLGLLEEVPDEFHVTGEVVGTVLAPSEAPAANACDPKVFAPAPDGNCPAAAN